MKSSLRQHYKRVNPCDPVFNDTSIEDLLYQLDAPRAVRRYTCQHCGKSYANRQGLYTHRRNTGCSNVSPSGTRERASRNTNNRNAELIAEMERLLAIVYPTVVFPEPFSTQVPPVITTNDTSTQVDTSVEESVSTSTEEESTSTQEQPATTTLPDVKLMGHIYVLIEREFLKTKETIYKVGCTNNLQRRFSQYPKGSVVLFTEAVMDYKAIERKLLNALLSTPEIKQAKDIGSEYFDCDLNDLKRVVRQVLGDTCDNTELAGHITSQQQE